MSFSNISVNNLAYNEHIKIIIFKITKFKNNAIHSPFTDKQKIHMKYLLQMNYSNGISETLENIDKNYFMIWIQKSLRHKSL